MGNKYIAIEGVDYAGNTSVISKLRNVLNDVEFIKQPSEDILDGGEVWHESMEFIFMADLLNIESKDIGPSIGTKTIISDRCFLTVLAYKESSGGCTNKYRSWFKNYATVPNHVILLTLTKEELIKRMKARGNVLEIENNSILARQNAYRRILIDMRIPFTEISTGIPIAGVTNKVLDVISNITSDVEIGGEEQALIDLRSELMHYHITNSELCSVYQNLCPTFGISIIVDENSIIADVKKREDNKGGICIKFPTVALDMPPLDTFRSILDGGLVTKWNEGFLEAFIAEVLKAEVPTKILTQDERTTKLKEELFTVSEDLVGKLFLDESIDTIFKLKDRLAVEVTLSGIKATGFRHVAGKESGISIIIDGTTLVVPNADVIKAILNDECYTDLRHYEFCNAFGKYLDDIMDAKTLEILEKHGHI